METIKGFKPIVGRSPKALILGSMPSATSLAKQQYYGHARNQFWPIMLGLLSGSAELNYREKVLLLKANRIALWDVIGSCKRKGSLDAHIQQQQANDIPGFLSRHRSIRKIFCNGNTAFKVLKKDFGAVELPIEILPSTSPAYTKPLEWKFKQWKKSLESICGG